MKRYLVLVMLLSASLSGNSQNGNRFRRNDNTYQREEAFIFSVSPDLLLNTPNGRQMGAGIKAQFFLPGRFSIDGDLVFSRDYAHFSPAVIGVPLALYLMNGNYDYTFTFRDVLACIALFTVSFEHLSYHIPVSYNFDISPYVSLLRYKYAYEFGNYSDQTFISEQCSFAAGLQLNRYIGRFVFSPYAEYCVGYKDHIPGMNVGVYLGIWFSGPE